MIGRIRRLEYERQILVVYMLAVFVTVIDSTMVNVALPAMADGFGVAANEAEWVAIGYLLAVAAVIPTAGWLGDRFGAKRVFLLALGWFTSMSMLCGFAQTLDQLVAFRILQGTGGGVLVPIGSAIVFRAYPLHRRASAAAAVMSVVVLAPALGPLVGGVLVDQASWRWIFFINLPIGSAGVVFAWLTMRSGREDAVGRLDVGGLVLSAGAFGLLVYTLSVGPESGWTSSRVLVLAVVGVSALAAMIVVETRHRDPLLALHLFHDRLFRTVNLSAAMFYAGFFGQIFVLPIYLQALRGESASVSGLVSSPQAFGVFLVSTVGGRRAYSVLGPRRMMAFGGVAAAAVSAMFALLGVDTPLTTVAGLALARGLAMGFVLLAIQTSVYATTSVPDTARAASLFNTQRQVAYAFGVALAATVLTAGLRDVGASAPMTDRLPPYQWAFFVVAIVMVPGAIVSLWVRDEDVAGTRVAPSTTDATAPVVPPSPAGDRDRRP